MKLETLFEANKIAKDLEKWRDMELRLECGNSFYQIIFRAQKNKTMFTEYDYYIQDKKTLDCFKEFVQSKITECESTLEKM